MARSGRPTKSQAKQDQRERGRYLGGKVPFGFRVGKDGELVADPHQQEAISTVRAMRTAGATLTVIQATLAERHGIKLSMGGLHGVLAG
jgi:putative DNA-invertase from lambdoid prophage Rac